MKRIFLVEDDKEIAKNLALLLRTEGLTLPTPLRRAKPYPFLTENGLIWRW